MVFLFLECYTIKVLFNLFLMGRFIKLISIVFVLSFFINIGFVSASVSSEYNEYTPYSALNFQAELLDDGVQMNWDVYIPSGYNYYKVIRSTTNSDPVYPDDGYIKYGSRELLDYKDESPVLGETNYYRVCSIAKPNRYCSDVISIEIPASLEGSDNEEEAEVLENGYNEYTLLEDINFTAELNESGVKMNWASYIPDGFNYYKVIRSTTNSDPVYPEDSYIKYGGADLLTYTDLSPKRGYTNYYRVCSIAKPDRYCSAVVAVEVSSEWNKTTDEPFGQFFKDIKQSDWVYKYARKMHALGLVKGSDGYLRPNNPISRSEGVTLLVRAYEKINGVIEYESNYNFDDVSSDFWAYENLQKALSIGMIAENQNFLPQMPITRGQIAKIITKTFLDSEITETAESSFVDVPSTFWAAKYIKVMKRKGLVGGFEDGTFKPNKPVSRAEAVKMIYKAIQTTNSDIIGYTEEI